MAATNDVIFAIKTLWEGNDAFKKAADSANKTKEKVDDLGKAAEKTKEKTQSMFKSFMAASAVQQGIRLLTNAVTGFISSSETLYRDYNAALVQLQNTMQNTMQASKSDVEHIVKFAEMQEKLGVVSKEVQLTGAKELTSYLHKKESLEALMPVMNDMLAYQYGLDATQEQASNTAMMLGKVLDGQVGALSRNGFTFNEAQEEVLKYGNESERVAVLAEVVNQTVLGVNEALAATPEGKIKRAANEYQEVQLKVGELVTKIRGEATAVLNKFVIKLWENRHALLAIVKVAASVAVGFVAFKTTVIAATVAGKIWKALIVAKNIAVGIFTGSLKIATLAMQIFNKVGKANVIGAVIGLLTAAAAAFVMFRKNANGASDAAKGLTAAKKMLNDIDLEAHNKANDELHRLKLLYDATQDLTRSQEMRTKAAKELIRLYPDVFKNMTAEMIMAGEAKDKYDQLSAAILRKAYVEAVSESLKDVEKEILDFNSTREYQTAADGTKYEVVDVSDVNAGFFSFKPTHRKRAEAAEKRADEIAKKEKALLDKKAVLEGKLSEFSDEELSTMLGIGEGNANAHGFDLEAFLSGNNNNSSPLDPSSSTAADSITAGGKSIKTFNINIESLIGENSNYFNSSQDNPASARDFMQLLSNALQMIVNDANYAAE